MVALVDFLLWSSPSFFPVSSFFFSLPLLSFLVSSLDLFSKDDIPAAAAPPSAPPIAPPTPAAAALARVSPSPGPFAALLALLFSPLL